MKKQIFYIITLSMLMCNCGEGMIGLLRPDKNGNLIYSEEYQLTEQGHVFLISVTGYFEPELDCTTQELTHVFLEKLIVVMDGEELNNPYIGPVQKSLHDNYVSLVCGE